MNIIETTFEKLPTKYLLIGFEGENLRATVRIDCASVFAEYPNATPTLIVKPLFADAYPVVVDRNGTDVDWLITSEILSFSGDGEIQLVFYKDEVICKSAVSKIRVCRSLQVTGEMPDPVVQWIENANRKLAEVDAVIVSIDEMDSTAHGLPEGSAPTAEVQTVDDHKRIVLGIPAGATGATGAKGDKGDKGEVGATPQMGIGTVQTLPAGSEATASMSGTTENPLLNLGIPQGIQGVKGDRGEKGDTGATGATGATPDFSIGTVSTLPAGSSATAEITGTAENPVLSLGIPQGVQGVQGERGEKGDPGEGVPTGGITGQVLAKASDTDYDTEWIHVAPVIKNTASGAIASFPDGADGHLVDELKVSIEPVQAGTGDPSPDNVRPITGWDTVKVTRTGINVWDEDWESGFFSYSGVKSNSPTAIRSKNFCVCAPGTRYYAFCGNAASALYVLWYDAEQNFIVRQNAKNTLIESPENAHYFKVSTDPSYQETYGHDISLNYPATDTEYHPGTVQTVDITLPTEAGTVYGGELTVNADGSGSLVVDKANVDLGSLTFAKNDSSLIGVPCFYATIPSVKAGAPYVACSDYTKKRERTFIDGTGQISPGNGVDATYCVVRDDRYATVDASAFKAAMSGVQLVYKLATPITYTLTASQIRTLLGQNNIWADTGDVVVKYNADTKAYVDNKESEAAPVKDVRVNGVSVMQGGVASVPVGANKIGAVNVSTDTSYGLQINTTTGFLQIAPATDADLKSANYASKPIGSASQHTAAFYGLAKAAGDTTQSASSNAVGQYTDEAKEAIAKMLGLRLWHEAYIDVNDYDSTLGMFILDVGEGNEVKDVRVNGQVVWDTAIAADSYFGVGVGNTTNRKNYSDFAQYTIAFSANRISVAADGHMIDPIGSYRCCMGYGYFGTSNSTAHALNVDTVCKTQMTCLQTCVYPSFNNPRYVHIVAPDNPSWALIKVEYTLK